MTASPSSKPAPPGWLGSLARGGVANLVGAASASVMTLALTLAVTRGVSPQVAGVFFAASSVFMLAAAVSQLGTNVGLVYFLSRARSFGTPRAFRSLYRMAMRPTLVVATCLGVALFVFAPQLSAVVNTELTDLSTTFLRSMAPFLPLIVLMQVTLSGTRGLGSMRPNVLTEQVGRPLTQLGLVVLCLFTVGESGLGYAWAGAYLPAVLLALLYWRRTLSGALRQGSSTSADVVDDEGPTRKEFWRFTSPRALAGVAQVTMQRFDIVLVAALAGATPAAIYTAATRFLVVGQAAQRAVSLAVQPRLAEALAVHDRDRARELYRVSTAWLMLVTWPIYLAFAFFGERLLAVFGADYSAGGTVLLLLSLTMLFATGCGMVDMVLVMAGRSTWSLYNVLLSLVVQVGLDLWLIPDYGILGAAIGWAAAIVAANLVPLLQVGLVYGLHPFGRATFVAFATLLTCFVIVPAAAIAILGAGWTGVAVSVAVGGASFLAVLWRARDQLQLTALAHITRRKAAAR